MAKFEKNKKAVKVCAASSALMLMILSDRLSDKHVLLSGYGLNYIRKDGT